MKFIVIIWALVITCIYANETIIYDNDGFSAYDMKVIECKQRRMEFLHGLRQVSCEPRPTLVQLSPQPNYIFYPNFVSVNRCGGYCQNNKSCIPVQIQAKYIPVRMNSYIFNQCYHVLVEEHIKCNCQCSEKESDCNDHQMYEQDKCACACINRESCKHRMVWSEKLCKCICDKPKEICPNGFIWIPSLCGCGQVKDMAIDSDV